MLVHVLTQFTQILIFDPYVNFDLKYLTNAATSGPDQGRSQLFLTGGGGVGGQNGGNTFFKGGKTIKKSWRPGRFFFCL